jgi:hypothetical protein
MSQYFYVKCLGDGSLLKHSYGKGAPRGDEFTMKKSEAVKLKQSEAERLGYPDEPFYVLIPCDAPPTLNDAITNARHALKNEEGYREHSDALVKLLDAVCTTVEENRESKKPPFGGIAFDPERKADIGGVIEVTPTNNQKADIGKTVVALYYLLAQREQGYLALTRWAAEVDLTQEPENTLADMLTDIMHYCHRDEIEFYGEHNPLHTAQRQFNVESKGASL